MPTRSSAASTTARFVVGEQPDARQPGDVRARTREVVGREAPVERQALGEREQLVGRALGEAAVPEGHVPVATGSAAGPPCSRAHVSTERPQRRTKPAESSWRKVSDGVVGGEVVAVEPAVGAPAGDEAPARLEPQADVAGDELLGVAHERVERLLERREPEAVVHELGVAGLEPRLLAHEVALERDRLEVGVREQHRERARALVGLAALDADPAVLDHVEPAPAVGAHRRAELDHELVQRLDDAVERDGDPLLEAHDDLAGLGSARRRRRASSAYASAGGDTHGSSIMPHSMARPQRFSSIEYGLFLVTLIGMSCFAA